MHQGSHVSPTLGVRNSSNPSVTTRNPRFLLLDDDPVFCRVVSVVARSLNIDVTECKTLDDFLKLAPWDFDVFLVDFDLGQKSTSSGPQVAEYLYFAGVRKPIYIVSAIDRPEMNALRTPIAGFLHKSSGAPEILNYLSHVTRSQNPKLFVAG